MLPEMPGRETRAESRAGVVKVAQRPGRHTAAMRHWGWGVARETESGAEKEKGERGCKETGKEKQRGREREGEVGGEL